MHKQEQDHHDYSYSRQNLKAPNKHATDGLSRRTPPTGNTFVVDDNLPKHLKQGELFSRGGELPIVARYSTEPGDPGLDYGHDQKEPYKHLEKRNDTELQTARDKVRNTHLESTRQYSQTAYRFGDYVIMYCLVPSSETQRKLYDETVSPEDGSDIILFV